MSLTEIIQKIFHVNAVPLPAVVDEFNTAAARLSTASQKLVKACDRDAFGDMVVDMQGRRPRKAAPKKKGPK